MIIPIRTDAPMYHRPVITLLLISINVFVYFLTIGGLGYGESGSHFRFLILEFGTINPLQWVTSFFMHGGLLHLIGNMIFLWTFGMIVEGKIGWWRFLILYMLLGISKSAIVQFLMLWTSSGGALGASGAIFGLMAISMLWAPRNDMTIFVLIFFYPFIFDVTVMGYCYFTIAWEFFTQYMMLPSSDGTMISIMSSAFLHLLGAGLGFYAGYWMLKTRRVDCEGYDLLSIWKGREGEQVLTLDQEEERKRREAETEAKRLQEEQNARQYVQFYLDQGRVDLAIKRFEKHRLIDPSAKMDIEPMRKIVSLLVKQEEWDQAQRFIEMLAKRAPKLAPAYRILSAEIYVTRLSRPRKGLRVLNLLRGVQVTDKQSATIAKLHQIAQTMIDDGLIEIEDP